MDEAMADETLRIEDAVNETCPWSGKPIAADSLTRYRGEVVGFCNPGCRDKFEAAIQHFEKAIADRDVPLIAKGIE
ncbi:glutathione S-transferase [Microvirga sp. M2]|uniref:glutathione S-transferase n=2 Tax=unclassified Microvirga TaxID=2617746 RepID=UPI0039C4AE96